MSEDPGSLRWQPVQFDNLSSFVTENSAEEESVASQEEVVSMVAHHQPVETVDSQTREDELAAVRDQARQQGYQEGFVVGSKEGHEQGFETGKLAAHEALAAEINEQRMVVTETITQLVANFRHELGAINEKIIPKLVHIALQAAQKIVGQLPDQVDKQLTRIIHELKNQYPPLGENIQLHVNPDDVSSVSHLLADELANQGWKLVLDSDIESGGCKVLSEKTEIDATVANKWQAMMTIVDENNN